MKKYLIIGILIFLGLSSIFIVKVGVGTRPTKIIKPSQVHLPEQIGTLLANRLFPEIDSNRVIILFSGFDVENYSRVWKGLFNQFINKKFILFEDTTLSSINDEHFSEFEALERNGDLINTRIFDKWLKNPEMKMVIHIKNERTNSKVILFDLLKYFQSYNIGVLFLGIESLHEKDKLNVQTSNPFSGKEQNPCDPEHISRYFGNKSIDSNKLNFLTEKCAQSSYITYILKN